MLPAERTHAVLVTRGCSHLHDCVPGCASDDGDVCEHDGGPWNPSRRHEPMSAFNMLCPVTQCLARQKRITPNKIMEALIQFQSFLILKVELNFQDSNWSYRFLFLGNSSTLCTTISSLS